MTTAPARNQAACAACQSAISLTDGTWAHGYQPYDLDHAAVPDVGPVREDFIDFPTGWRLQTEGLTHTDPRCSAVQTDGALLCDCGAIQTEWARRVAEQKASAAHPYVWVAPGRLGGKPCIGGTRLAVDQVARIAVDGVAAVQAGWPYLTRAQVLVACWYQAVHGTRAWHRRWGAWAEQHSGAMWSGKWDQVPDPTSSQESAA